MRISTAMLHAQGVANILRNQTTLARTQNELALATRLISAKDDPGAWARAANLDQHLAQLERYRSNTNIAQHRLGLEESALVSVTDTLNRVRELALQASNATTSADARQSIAQEIQSRLGELLSAANATDGDGRYLFAGTADGAAPFALAVVGATYTGSASTRLIDIGPERGIALGDAGDAVFGNLRTGNGTFAVTADANNAGQAKLDAAKVVDAASWDAGTYTLSFSGGNYEVRDAGNALVASGAYTSGTAISFRGVQLTISGAPVDGDRFEVAPSQSQDLFAIVQKMAALFATTPADPAANARHQTAFHGALEELDAAMSHISSVRAGVGFRLHAVDDALAQIDTLDVHSQGSLSELRDLDYAEATSRLNLQMTALQAAQQSYARIQGLSLFDFLR